VDTRRQREAGYVRCTRSAPRICSATNCAFGLLVKSRLLDLLHHCMAERATSRYRGSNSRRSSVLADPLVEVCGINAARRPGRLAAGSPMPLVSCSPSAPTPDEVRARANRDRERYPKAQLTPATLANQWPDLNVPQWIHGGWHPPERNFRHGDRAHCRRLVPRRRM
jgi:hypothetical protein